MSNFSYTPPLFDDDNSDNSLELNIKGKKVIVTFQISLVQLDLLKNVAEY